jgi:hypothetical protein
VFSSSTLIAYTKLRVLDRIQMGRPYIHPLVQDELRQKLMEYESVRLTYRYDDMPKSVDGLIEDVLSMPGPRILIMNTNQSASSMSMLMRQNRRNVFYLSDELAPEKYEAVYHKVNGLLTDGTKTDWTFVTTADVAIGLDFSFRFGFCEASTPQYLGCCSGLVNRDGLYGDSEMRCFTMQDHPNLEDGGWREKAFGDMKTAFFCQQPAITPEVCTHNKDLEIYNHDWRIKYMCDLLQKEEDLCFQSINNEVRRLIFSSEKLGDRVEILVNSLPSNSLKDDGERK